MREVEVEIECEGLLNEGEENEQPCDYVGEAEGAVEYGSEFAEGECPMCDSSFRVIYGSSLADDYDLQRDQELEREDW